MRILSVEHFERSLDIALSHGLDPCPEISEVRTAYRALHNRSAASPTLKAWLTHDKRDKCNIEEPYMVSVGHKPFRSNSRWEPGRGPCFMMVKESAIPESLRLEPGGGPVKIGLVFSPVKPEEVS